MVNLRFVPTTAVITNQPHPFSGAHITAVGIIVRTTLMIEDDVSAAAKRIAEKSGRSLVVSRLARKGLSAEQVTDFYLMVLAGMHSAKIATFKSGLRAIATVEKFE
jgi:hypothetical protein